MEVMLTPLDPKVGLLRSDEFKSTPSKEEEETNRCTENPQFKKPMDFRISNTRNYWFQKSHFTRLLCHATGDQLLLSKFVDAYEQAPKWEPFPRAILSPEGLEKMANKKAKCLEELRIGSNREAVVFSNSIW